MVRLPAHPTGRISAVPPSSLPAATPPSHPTTADSPPLGRWCSLAFVAGKKPPASRRAAQRQRGGRGRVVLAGPPPWVVPPNTAPGHSNRRRPWVSPQRSKTAPPQNAAAAHILGCLDDDMMKKGGEKEGGLLRVLVGETSGRTFSGCFARGRCHVCRFAVAVSPRALQRTGRPAHSASIPLAAALYLTHLTAWLDLSGPRKDL